MATKPMSGLSDARLQEDINALMSQVKPYCYCGQCEWNRESAKELRAELTRRAERKTI